MRLAARLRRIALAASFAALAACAHRPAQPAAPAKTVIPPVTATPAPTAPALPTAPAASSALPKVASLGGPPQSAAADYSDLWDRIRAGFALPEVQEPAIDEQLQWFVHNPDFLERTFQRAELYLYHVVTEVEARGMPMEFALLPIVESAYQPFAYSPSRAAGLWQFIPDTGRRFGLKQDWWFDGRRDVIDSTRAALDYFQALHDQFGDWELAIAAYNVGELTVQRAIDSNRAAGLPTDFWHLKLPAETRAYVPRLLALKRLIAEPERYGLQFAPIPNEPYFAVVHPGGQIDLKIAAKLAGVSYDELVELNPGFNRWATDPDGPDRLLVPIDDADTFEAKLKALPPDGRMQYVEHVVHRRETLRLLARRFDTTPAVIMKLNDLHGWRLRTGESLKIPQASAEVPHAVLVAAERVDRPQYARHGRFHRRIVYRVHRGETLGAIARRHRVPVATLARLNHLGPHDRIIAGQRLYIEQVSMRSYAPHYRHYRGRGERLHSNRRLTYRVRKGDTVYSIARQFQVSMKQLKHWNGLNRRHLIRAGQRLVLYVAPNRREG
ncbi:MAG: LysM peptidoglycan-binding domain-containing protein [Gammaproteobacteria bacterium]|nr:LysM peptidoglycan-binding domain-containing protein [Gammaproteobacteria bacterium]